MFGGFGSERRRQKRSKEKERKRAEIKKRRAEAEALEQVCGYVSTYVCAWSLSYGGLFVSASNKNSITHYTYRHPQKIKAATEKRKQAVALQELEKKESARRKALEVCTLSTQCA